MMAILFYLIVGALYLTAYVTGLTYVEVNIILYFFVIPLSWVAMLDKYFSFHWLKIGFAILCAVFFAVCSNLSAFNSWLFDVSVVFLEWFERYNMDYIMASIIFCVAFPLLVYLVLGGMLYKKYRKPTPKKVLFTFAKITWTKRRVVIVSIGVALLATFCVQRPVSNTVFNRTIQYKPTGEIRPSEALNQKSMAYVQSFNAANTATDIDDIMAVSLKITAQTLSYGYGLNSGTNNNPNKLIELRKADCGGYSVLFAAVCNYLLQRNNLSNTYVAKAIPVKVYMWHKPIQQFIPNNGFVSHAFVIIENKQTKEIRTIDPTFWDMCGISCKNITLL